MRVTKKKSEPAENTRDDEVDTARETGKADS